MFELYSNLSEHAHQRELFAWSAYASRFGFAQAREWLNSHPIHLKRPKFDHTPLPAPFVPLTYLHAIPNGGSRGSDTRSAAIVGSKMKAEGVKRGIPDIFLPWPAPGLYHGLYIELKTLKGRLSKEQKAFLEYANSVGYLAVCCHGYLEAVNIIEGYCGQECEANPNPL